MTYQETIDFLYKQLPVFHRIGKAAYKANLENTIALDRYFGYPHLKFRSVHVAGTNGKGSVSHMLASVFQEAGYKTGLYTSPHLKDYRERIRICGSMIPEEEVISFVEEHIKIIGKLKPSFFEMSVALAFDYFARAKVDVAVVETGLGGRLDSTNIIKPVLSIITNIGHDHIDLLGNTLEKIATEKAGIIKHRIPVIIGETSRETSDIFLAKAYETGSDIIFADQRYNCTLDRIEDPACRREYILTNTLTGNKIKGHAGLAGDYQSRNIPVVACAADLLQSIFNITPDHVQKGIEKVIENTGLLGRWQVLGQQPLVICDTGHNREGLAWVMNQLSSLNAPRLHFVIGFVNDKDLGLILPLFPKEAEYYFTKAAVPRALDHNILKMRASEYGLSGDAFNSTTDALQAARRKASADEIIFVGGSTFVVAEII